ncbi:MAG TPA: dihydroneopterin aldolase [Nitrospiraceae bacterium]|nr:dihydroneopterin aldolase [Nitrospiraceae bacterium]
MASHLIIEDLEFQGHCGVTPQERQVAQPIAVDLELDYPAEPAATTDDIGNAVDYAQVSERVIDVGTREEFSLVETLADRLTNMVFAEFPVNRVRLWVRKIAPPLKHVRGSVGVRLDRLRPAHLVDSAPARFLTEQLHHLTKGRVLDVAAGSGRNALYLAAQGYQVEAIDRDKQALTILEVTARQRHLANLTVRQVELEGNPDLPPDIPKRRYDTILVFFYLYRPLFTALLEALKPGGVLIYETFLIDNHLRRQHPRRWEFCLAHNELLRLTSGLRVLHYDEGEHEGGPDSGPAFTARLVAQKPARREKQHEPD